MSIQTRTCFCLLLLISEAKIIDLQIKVLGPRACVMQSLSSLYSCLLSRAVAVVILCNSETDFKCSPVLSGSAKVTSWTV